MINNTPLQDLIEYCNKCEKASSDRMMKFAMRGIIQKATELLPNETTREQELEDIKARFHPLIRARNDFFLKLRKGIPRTQEQYITLFEEIFHVSQLDFDNAKVLRWDEMPEHLKGEE